MNLSKSILALLFSLVLVVSCKEKATEAVSESKSKTEAPKAKREIATADLQSASFTIKGMTCAIGCAKTIEEELNGLDGVKTASVDFDKELATVSFDKTILTPEKLTKVVEATADGKSYKVSNFKL
jgi:copper chaperone CopZ